MKKLERGIPENPKISGKISTFSSRSDVAEFLRKWSWDWGIYLVLKIFKFGALEDVGGTWLEFGILILIWVSLFESNEYFLQILDLYVEFKSAKNPHFLITFNEGCGRHWRLLIGILDLQLDFNHISWSYGPLCWIWVFYAEFKGTKTPLVINALN